MASFGKQKGLQSIGDDMWSHFGVGPMIVIMMKKKNILAPLYIFIGGSGDLSGSYLRATTTQHSAVRYRICIEE